MFIFSLRYTGWLCRGMVSATTYTLVGVVNKFFTVLLNVIIWDKHSTPFGIFAVCLCLGAGTLYQQSPRRDEARNNKSTEMVSSAVGNGIDVESQPLISGGNSGRK
jgi:GDP-mannose transporter